MDKAQFIKEKMFFACDEKQFQEGLKKLDTVETNIMGFDCCYFKKDDKDLFLTIFKK